ncbi:MAG: hypothetical protein MUO88_00880 [Desulfobacterales bacterium]|nr:hypothetical protein [Desulfobacterales bacterium]
MITQKKYLNLTALLVALITGVMFLPGLTHAAVSSDIETADFGEVVLGESSSVDIEIANSDDDDFITLFFEIPIPNCGFSVYPLSYRLINGQSMTIKITYTPSAPGACSSTLYIYNNDKVKLGEVNLIGKGKGIEAQEDDITVGDILAFFDQCAADGSLEGNVPSKSAKKKLADKTPKGDGSDKLAENRLNALRNMIETAGNLIDSGKTDEACGQLKAAYKKMDGSNTPGSSTDFVTGVAVSDLSDMVQALMDRLGCK